MNHIYDNDNKDYYDYFMTKWLIKLA